MYSECDIYNKANVHFYYDPEDNCMSPRIEDENNGSIIKVGSDPIPPHKRVDCNFQCPNDGEFLNINITDFTINQACQTCPEDSIAISGGFRIDLKMDDNDFLQEKIANHFEMGCIYFN